MEVKEISYREDKPLEMSIGKDKAGERRIDKARVVILGCGFSHMMAVETWGGEVITVLCSSCGHCQSFFVYQIVPDDVRAIKQEKSWHWDDIKCKPKDDWRIKSEKSDLNAKAAEEHFLKLLGSQELAKKIKNRYFRDE